jgi:hypothetical protein
MAYEDINRRRRGPGKFGPSDAERDDELQKKQAYGIAMYGTAEEYRDLEAEGDEAEEELFDSGTFGPGWEETTAPTTTPSYPRAHKIAYHRKTKSLVIEFRAPGSKKTGRTGPRPWVLYYDVDLEMWEELTNYHSTGEWLKYSGVEMGNYDRLGQPNKSVLSKMIENYTGMSVEDLSMSQNTL